jgi:predicted O-methyltransferase YrrM
MIDSTPTATLLKKAIRHPLRAVRRLVENARQSWLSDAKERELLVDFLSNVFDADTQRILDEYERCGIGGWMERRRAELRDFPGPYRLGSTPAIDCETIYFLVRAMKPNVVVETGVCYGVSSAYILQALKDNDRGTLYSIDLGNTPHEPPNDFFVPLNLKSRWHLIIGDCKQALPLLLAQLRQIDLFHHDSLHTYEHMMWEYEIAHAYLGPSGVLSSHDVRTIVNLRKPLQRNPFETFCEQNRLYSVMSHNVGIAIGDRHSQAERGAFARIDESPSRAPTRRTH